MPESVPPGAPADRGKQPNRLEIERLSSLFRSTLAMMFCARIFPSRDACCAVGGRNSPVAAIGNEAQSPVPKRFVAFYFEVRFRLYSIPFLRARHQSERRIWRRPGSPNNVELRSSPIAQFHFCRT